MSEMTIDARGLSCPKPLMAVKKALDGADVGTQLIVLLDNDIACSNVTRFLRDNHAEPVVEKEEGEYRIRARAGEASLGASDPMAYCVPSGHPEGSGPLVMVFAGDVMGKGDQDLGRLLIQACINTLPEMDCGPQVLIFYSSGIHLAREDSPVLDSLKKLEAQGVRILVCGTCVDYYRAKGEIQVGLISNMFEILEALCGASRIIYP